MGFEGSTHSNKQKIQELENEIYKKKQEYQVKNLSELQDLS